MNGIKFLYKITVLLYLMLSSYIWFFFTLPRNSIPVIVSIIMGVCLMTGKIKFNFSFQVIAFLGVLFLYSIYSTYIVNLSYGMLNFMYYLPALLIFVVDRDFQLETLKFVTKWFSIFLGIGLVMFIINIVVPLPHTEFSIPDHSFYGEFDNFFFFLHNRGELQATANSIISRFCGPFLEPGHMALVCTLLLFANRYKMKEQPLLWILVAATILSFSLAGYVIMAVSLMLLKIRNLVSMITIVSAFLGVWIFFGSIYNDGDNVVNNLILSRLEMDESKGIAGNNRTSTRTDYFYRQVIKENRHWYGVRTWDKYAYKIEGSGYKIFILHNGVIGIAFIFLLYLLLIAPKSNRRYAISFLFLMVIVFIQRSYPFWYSWLFSYVAGIGITRGMPFDAPLYPKDDEESDGNEENELEDEDIKEEVESSEDYKLQTLPA